MTRDHYALAVERAVDELGQVILRVGDAMLTHEPKNSYLIAILQARREARPGTIERLERRRRILLALDPGYAFGSNAVGQ